MLDHLLHGVPTARARGALRTLVMGSVLTDHPDIYSSEVRGAEVDDIHGLG